MADGVRVVETEHEARKTIRVTAETLGDKILRLIFSGDFFMIPHDSLPELESRLKSATLSRGELCDILYRLEYESLVKDIMFMVVMLLKGRSKRCC